MRGYIIEMGSPHPRQRARRRSHDSTGMFSYQASPLPQRGQCDAGFTIDSFGLTGDLPAQGDFDGDGKTDHTIYRPSNGIWYVYRSSDRNVVYYTWGLSTDVPVGRDYDGDGQVDPAVYRPSPGRWFVLQSSTNFSSASTGSFPTLKRMRFVRNRSLSSRPG